ncbi:MAG: hypothetical protein LBV08_09465 [Clostridiales bacterium]|nr:hypothetical protein [Clostridiales bacterium]
MWARLKKEAIYGSLNTKLLSMDCVKSIVFRYFMGYWNNHHICHSIGGFPPFVKRKLFFESLANAA